MIFAYKILTNLIYPFLFIFLYFRVLLKKEDTVRFKEKILTKYFNIDKNSKLDLLWFHAASIGELKSVIPIIKNINNKSKNLEFLVTTTTLSSSKLASLEFEKLNNIKHRFIPYDVSHLVETFIDKWKPKKIFLVDSEIWPNLILKAKKRGISIALINARLTKKSFSRWSKFPMTAKKIFNKFDLFLCANQETKNYLEKLSAKNIRYFGNIKFFNEIKKKEFSQNNIQVIKKSRFWVAASIHKEEDIICLKTHLKLKKKFDDIITIIAPRHINRVDQIYNLSKKLNLNTQILNQNDRILSDKEIIIINFFGALQDYFQYARSVFIGKSLIERLKYDSGQNPIDAALLNCKIYHGPYVSNFDEIYQILKKNHIAKEIKNYNELSLNLENDLKDIQENKRNLPNQFLKNLSQNILSKTMQTVENFIND